MKILGFKPDHDGSGVLLENGELIFSIEQEKDSQRRNAHLSLDGILHSISKLDGIPDVIALSGWRDFQAGYYGTGNIITAQKRFWHKDVEIYSCSHERSHLLGAYGMSPFPQGMPCYALLWEGTIGSFYKIDGNVQISAFPEVLNHPVVRYSYAYYLGGPNESRPGWWERQDMAGKLMALSGCRSRGKLEPLESALSQHILTAPIAKENQVLQAVLKTLPSDKTKTPFQAAVIDAGHESARFRNFAAHHSDALFDIFYRFAERHLTERLPLLITGGCGLNCEWNTRWKNTGLFEEVFIPPCPNDSGCAIGTAVDAQHHYTGNAKINWSVYAGEEFQIDLSEPPLGWTTLPNKIDEIARTLASGEIIAWVQGKYEIGPRALGNRSLLAAPFEKKITKRLNQIKEREGYRPIAPVCLEEDVSEHFDWEGPSPFMLHFQRVRNSSLQAVTHDDGSARVQTVSTKTNPSLYALLRAFKGLTGTGVLCNTSLNFKGKGFINKLSDLLRYCADSQITTAVVNDVAYVREPKPGRE